MNERAADLAEIVSACYRRLETSVLYLGVRGYVPSAGELVSLLGDERAVLDALPSGSRAIITVAFD